MINVLVVDDQILLRKSISQILNTDESLKVIGEVGSGKEAIASCEKNCPDVILMDIEMPEMDGIVASRIIKSQHKQIKIIILTTFENMENIIKSFAEDVDGYIVKDIGCEELISTIKCVNYGLTVIHKSVKRLMVDKFQLIQTTKPHAIHSISPEEIDIIRLIVMGKSNKTIADMFNYTEGTIKNKITKIYKKLDVEDRVQLALYATQQNIV